MPVKRAALPSDVSPLEIDARHQLERLGLQLKVAMAARCLTIHTVATAAEITPEYLVRILDGQERDLDLGLLVNLADVVDHQVKIALVRDQALPDRKDRP